MLSYKNLVEQVLENGKVRANRTGVNALTISGALVEHDMAEGFPLLTTKKMPFKSIKVELEFFIKGLRDKKWLQERGCYIWDEWANPQKLPSLYRKNSVADELFMHKKKALQKEEKDLGKIYGYQWRNFNGYDQLKKGIDDLKEDPNNRRIIVSAWNPTELDEMALPPCHVLFHLSALSGYLNLVWFQRSCDLALGIPFNIASYALLLHLVAKECKLKEGKLTGMLSDVHIYENHIDALKEQLIREPYPLPKIKTQDFTNIYEWEHKDTKLVNYKSHSKIYFEIAV